MIGLRCLTLLIALLLNGAPAHSAANETTVSVTFLESAPKDSFTITNAGNCKIQNLRVQIDLASSTGRLIFDPTGSGAGVEVFQPLEVTSGQPHIASISKVSDGSQDVTLRLNSLAPGAKVSFTIDVDDTLPRDLSELGQTRVSDSEIYGAEIYIKPGDGATVVAAFGADATAQLRRLPCV